MNCSLCGNEANIVVVYSPEEIWSCDRDYKELAKVYLRDNSRARLNKTIESYTRKDGTKGKITSGKAWEIENRRVSRDDGKSVINAKTGKPAQY